MTNFIPKTPAEIKNILLLLYYWAGTGFLLGTLTLMGPVRWTATYARAHGWPYAAEKAAVLCFIALLAAVSFLCARLLARRVSAAAGPAKKLLAAAPLAAFAVSLWFWMNPALMIDRGAKDTALNFADTQFVFGPYPEEARMKELKAANYAAVISLLSPAVVPFEPVLLQREKDLAQALGVELIHIPMLPWVSSNDHVEARLKEIASRGPGKYYVHCYLGKDRVNVFGKILSGLSAGAVQTSQQPGSARKLSDVKKFERGPVTVLAPDVYLTPYPTDEEFFGYILNGNVENIVSLLDPANPEDLGWIKKEKEISEKYRVALTNYPWHSLDKAARGKAVAGIKKLKKPTVIHAFLCKGQDYEDFLAAYRGR